MPVQIPYKWVVNCKSVDSGEKALTYLGRYLYKGVIQEKDIVACKDDQVSFRYRDSKTQRMKTRTVTGTQLILMADSQARAAQRLSTCPSLWLSTP